MTTLPASDSHSSGSLFSHTSFRTGGATPLLGRLASTACVSADRTGWVAVAVGFCVAVGAGIVSVGAVVGGSAVLVAAAVFVGGTVVFVGIGFVGDASAIGDAGGLELVAL